MKFGCWTKGDWETNGSEAWGDRLGGLLGKGATKEEGSRKGDGARSWREISVRARLARRGERMWGAWMSSSSSSRVRSMWFEWEKGGLGETGDGAAMEEERFKTLKSGCSTFFN